MRAASVLLLVAVAACGHRDGAEVTVSGERNPTTTESTGATGPRPTAPAGSTDATSTATPAALAHDRADDGTVEVRISLVGEVAAGTRLWADVAVRNIGDRTVYWQAGGSSPPITAVLVREGEEDPGPAPPRPWDGDPSRLRQQLTVPARPEFREPETIGLETVARTSESHMAQLRPGDEWAQRVAADVRLPAGAATGLVARATFLGYDEPDHYGGSGSVGPRRPVTVEIPIRVTALPSDAGPAVEAFARDAGLAGFVDATRVAGVDNGWYAVVAWWRDAWELVVNPVYGDDPRGQSRYRLRYDPAAGRVVDARRIWWDQAPGDDPDGTRFPGAPADDVERR